MRARDLELAALYQGGATLQEIGDAVGLSRERVRQRIARVRPWGLDIRGTGYWNLGRMLARLTRAERHRRRAAVAAAVIRCARRHGSVPTYGEVAEAVLGIPRNSNGATVRLVQYVSPLLRRGRTRLLRAIWRRCGFTPRRPGGRIRVGAEPVEEAV